MESFDYRDRLKSEYASRRERNIGYSLRAFARDLGVTYSRLHEAMSGKRGISPASAENLAKKIGLSLAERKLFLAQVEAEHGRSRTTREQAQKRVETFKEEQNSFATLQKDVFELIAHWYHYAILELTLVKDFSSDPDWIGKRLGISKTEAELAIKRLLNLGLLERRQGKLMANDTVSISPQNIPSDGIKKHHEQIMQKARDAIYFQSLEERDLSAVTVAIRREKIPEIKTRIQEFRRSLMKELDAEPLPRDSVYCLATQLFCLDQEEK